MPDGLIATLFSFRHRLARATFWWCCIAAWICFAIMFVFLASSLGRGSTWALYPPFLWILMALLVKRLHDLGKQGMYSFDFVLPAPPLGFLPSCM